MQKKHIFGITVFLIMVLIIKSNINIAETGRIDIELLENSQSISGELFNKLIIDGEKFKIGKKYKEQLSVKNNEMDAYVRVAIYKKWKDNAELNPYMIQLEMDKTGAWIIDENACTPTTTVMYYSKYLKNNEITPNFIDSIKIDNKILSETTIKTAIGPNGCQNIETSYAYNNANFELEVEAHAIQTHNMDSESLLQAWGTNIIINPDGSLSLVE